MNGHEGSSHLSSELLHALVSFGDGTEPVHQVRDAPGGEAAGDGHVQRIHDEVLEHLVIEGHLPQEDVTKSGRDNASVIELFLQNTTVL